MPVTLVNRQERQGTAADPVTFSGLTANTTGNGLFLFVASRTGSANTVGSVTDNVGHTWIIHGTVQNSGSNNRATWAYVPQTTGQVTSISVTLSPTSSTIPISITLFEVSGHDTVTPVHTSNYAPDTVSDTTYNAGSITTSVGGCLVLSGVTISSQSALTSLTVPGPLGNVSYLSGSTTVHMIGSSYASLTGTATVTATYTSSRASTSSGAIIAIAPASGAGTHTTVLGNWRWYTDAADGSMTPLALENEAPRLTGTQMQNAIIRLRIQLTETGGTGGSGVIALQYSADGGTSWNSLQEQAQISNEEGWWFRYANGAATTGATVTSTKLTGSTESGKYHENGTTSASVGANAVHELDVAVRIHWPPPDTSIQFRVMYGGTALPLVSTPPTNVSDPVRAAFYYPWFPGAWTQTGMLSGQTIYPFSYHRPKRGYYNLTAGDISSHIEQMRYGNISVGIISWWGQGGREDQKVPLLLKQARGTNFRWAFYYEQEGFGNPTEAQIRSDLNYLVAQYGSHPNAAKINGRLVVFVYAADDDANGNEVLTRWTAANDQANVYINMKILTGYTGLTPQPDSWHQYAPANRTQSHGSYSYTISPGFELTDRTLDQPYLARDLSAFSAAVSSMESSSARWKLVTTFNEWGENSGVEATDQYASVSGYGDYLDALHAVGSLPASYVGDYPSLITSSAEARPHTITRLGADGSQKTSREVRYGPWERAVFQQGKWWFFTAQTEDALRIYPYVREADGTWRATTTKTTSTAGTQSRQAFAAKEIGGVSVVHAIQGTSTSTLRGARGVLNGATGEVTWGSEWSASQASDRTRNVAIDDGNYIWVGGIQAGTGIWVRRSTNVDSGSSWTSGFDPQRTAADTGVVSGDIFTLIGLSSNKVLAVWRSGNALKWCTVSGSTVSAVGTVNTTSVAGPEDWGMTRKGNYVFLIHSDVVGSGGSWVLRVYDITANTWTTATSPGVSGQPSNNDGIPISVNSTANELYAFGTFANTEGGQDRKIQYKTYTWSPGNEATGTWGSLTDLTPPGARGNSDHLSVSRQSGNGEILVVSAFGDDDNAANPRVAEVFSLTVGATPGAARTQIVWIV